MANLVATIHNSLKEASDHIQTIGEGTICYISDFKEGAHQKVVVVTGMVQGVHEGHLQVIDYPFGIGHGSINGNEIKELATGSKSGISTGAYKLVEADDYVQPPDETDLQFYVQSTSGNDTSDGSGVQQFTIVYLSAAGGAKKTQIITMNGTNQVTIPLVDKYRIHSVDVTRGHPAAGTISITNQPAGILYGSIEQHKTYMERCIFYVAVGEKVTGIEAVCSSTTSGGVYISIFASEEDASGNVVTRARIPFRINDTTLAMKFELPEQVSNPNDKLIAFGAAVTGATGAANQDCEVTLKGFTESI